MKQRFPSLELSEHDLDLNPIRQFAQWFREARKCKEILLPEAMCLATMDEEGFPSSRMVLLKGFDEKGFVFFTNLASPKGRDLEVRPRASLTFYWERLKRQVRIGGSTKRVSDAEADDYFQTRPRGSQIGAWASLQSEVLKSRSILEKRFDEFSQKFSGKPVPRPPSWTGIRVVPLKIEFWQERPDRLHDRFLYVKEGRGWKINRLYP